MHRSSFSTLMTLGLSVALGLATSACGGSDDDDAATPGTTHIEIEGSWSSDFGGTETIDDDSWSTSYGAQDIVAYSNGDREAVLSGPDFTDPEKTVFSRVVWTEPADGIFYYCTATFGCETAELTATGDDDDDNKVCDPPMVDETDLDGAGCAGFSWTKLSKE